MLFAKIKEKLLNRRNDIEISEITDDSGTPLDAEKMFELLSLVNFESETIKLDHLKLGALDVNEAYGGTGEIYLKDLTYLVDEDEVSLFPLENNAGKVLAVNEDEDGLEAVEKGTKLYKYEIEATTPSGLQLIIIASEYLDGADELAAFLDIFYEHGTLISIYGNATYGNMSYDYNNSRLYTYDTTTSQFVIINCASNSVIDFDVVGM